jgi:hypothetical protein
MSVCPHWHLPAQVGLSLKPCSVSFLSFWEPGLGIEVAMAVGDVGGVSLDRGLNPSAGAKAFGYLWVSDCACVCV